MTGTSKQYDTHSVGQILKSCREQRNISVLEVASKMRLDAKIINALEENRFDSLPNAIYVRGYIRGYSKLVGSNADELVSLYEEHGGDFEPEIIPEIKHPSQTSSRDRPVKAVTWLIILALGVLLIAWWQSNSVIRLPVPSTATVEPLPQVKETQIVRPIYAPPQPAPVTTPSVDLAGQNIANTQTNMAGLTEAGTTLSNEAQTGMSELPPVGTTVSSQAPIHQTTGPDLIVLRLTADSWIEITDANNAKVFFDLGRPGDVFNVRGSTPFNVLLGYAQAVTVEYNGNPINVAQYSRAGVARFTLDQ